MVLSTLSHHLGIKKVPKKRKLESKYELLFSKLCIDLDNICLSGLIGTV